MTNKNYVVTITGVDPERVRKAAEHFGMSLHWSKMFYTTKQVDANTIECYGNWTTYASDMSNFKVYYPTLSFAVHVFSEDPNAAEELFSV